MTPPQGMARRQRAGIALVVLVALAGCARDDASKAAKTKTTAPATVTTTVVQPSAWWDTIDAIGTAHANESIAVTAKVSETVDDVRFESGDFVHAGQVLVTLSGKSQAAGLQEASASYRAAEDLYARQKALADRQLIAASAIAAQRGARDAAKAAVEQQRAGLSDRVIVAPFDGVLGLRQVSRGSLVTPNAVIATLDDVSTIKLDFSIPERFLPALAKGQPVLARSDAYPGVVFRGTISTLDARVDPVTRAVTAQARIPNPDRKLRAGMLLDVAVQRPARQVLQVPELAIQQVGQQANIYRVAGGKAALVPVTIGARQPGSVEIVEGLRAGDRIVVEGIVKLHDGSPVTEAAAPAGAAGRDPAAHGAN